VLAGRLSAIQGQEAIDNWSNITLVRHSHEQLLSRVWQLRANLSAYDAAYIALAEALSAPLLTRDAKLASAPGHHALIELV
jgi:predicted nucleic acid-binding protein